MAMGARKVPCGAQLSCNVIIVWEICQLILCAPWEQSAADAEESDCMRFVPAQNGQQVGHISAEQVRSHAAGPSLGTCA